MDISPPHSYSPLPQSIYSQNGLPSPQKSMSPGYESPYGSHRDLLVATTATTRQNGGSSGGQVQTASAASPASSPHSYSPLPHVYGQNGQTRQNGSNVSSQNITITAAAPSPTLSAQSGSLHSPSEQQQMDKLWNGKLMETSPCPTSNAGHHHNGSQSTGFVQITQHHLQQPHHQQHHHNQNNRELIGNTSPPPSNMLQRVSCQPPSEGLIALTSHNSLQTLNQSENNGNNSNNNNAKSSGKLSASSAASLSLTSDVEEINTKELAQRISAELKRYSIPQAIFAQRVLCRSQVRRTSSDGNS